MRLALPEGVEGVTEVFLAGDKTRHAQPDGLQDQVFIDCVDVRQNDGSRADTLTNLRFG
jgi:hypothetical protein